MLLSAVLVLCQAVTVFQALHKGRPSSEKKRKLYARRLRAGRKFLQGVDTDVNISSKTSTLPRAKY
jgi:hypothetical protein